MVAGANPGTQWRRGPMTTALTIAPTISAPIATATTAFDYAALTTELADNRRPQAARIRQRVADQAVSVIETGCDLLAAKVHLERGLFHRWVETEIGIEVRTAQRYMNAAKLVEGRHDIV